MVTDRRTIAQGFIGEPRDLHPDGTRLLVTRPVGAGGPDAGEQDVVIVTNWFGELHRRLAREPR